MRKTSTPVLLSLRILNALDDGLYRVGRRVMYLDDELKGSLKRVRKALYDELLDRADEMPWAQWVRDHPYEPDEGEIAKLEYEEKWHPRPRWRPRGWHGLTW